MINSLQIIEKLIRINKEILSIDYFHVCGDVGEF